MSNEVIDVSCWNPIKDYKALSSKISGVMIRAGYRSLNNGQLFTDARFNAHVNGFKANNVPIGVYYFSTAINKQEGIEEADYLLKLVKEANITPKFPLAIDTEWTNKSHTGRSDQISISDRTDAVIAFCEEIIKHGYIPCIYSFDTWFYSALEIDKIKNYKKWVARTTTPQVVKSYIGWQYAQKSYPGVPGQLDTNHWYIDINENSAKINVVKPLDPTTVKPQLPVLDPSDSTKVILKNSPVYTSSAATKATIYKTGTYYIWNSKAVNGKIRITTDKSFIGNVSKITGWVDAPKQATVEVVAGKSVTLKRAGLYTSAASNKVVAYKTGIYYLWDSRVVSGKIRIVASKADVGKPAKIIGWINANWIK